MQDMQIGSWSKSAQPKHKSFLKNKESKKDFGHGSSGRAPASKCEALSSKPITSTYHKHTHIIHTYIHMSQALPAERSWKLRPQCSEHILHAELGKGVVQSLLVGEGAVTRDCRGVGKMPVMYKVNIIDFSEW
jgi:hypothetical protein